MILTIVILGILVGIWSITGLFDCLMDLKIHDIHRFILFGPITWIVGLFILIFGFICTIYRCLKNGFKKEWPW